MPDRIRAHTRALLQSNYTQKAIISSVHHFFLSIVKEISLHSASILFVVVLHIYLNDVIAVLFGVYIHTLKVNEPYSVTVCHRSILV